MVEATMCQIRATRLLSTKSPVAGIALESESVEAGPDFVAFTAIHCDHALVQQHPVRFVVGGELVNDVLHTGGGGCGYHQHL